MSHFAYLFLHKVNVQTTISKQEHFELFESLFLSLGLGGEDHLKHKPELEGALSDKVIGCKEKRQYLPLYLTQGLTSN